MIKLRRLRLAGHRARIRGDEEYVKILVLKPEGKRPPERPRNRCVWIIHIKMVLRYIELDDMYWIDLAGDRDWWRAYLNTAMNLLKEHCRMECYEITNA
jgi:hypothetical protein